MSKKEKRKSKTTHHVDPIFRTIQGILALMVLCAFGIYAFLHWYWSVPHVVEACEQYITGLTGIQIERVDTGGANYKTIFYSTDDGGNSWVQFHEVAYDPESLQPDCNKVSAYKDQVIAVWWEDEIAISYDRGTIWRISQINDSENSYSWAILAVTFSDKHTIETQMIKHHTDEYRKYLTTDGGLTWQLDGDNE